jgi:hypothetical protein
VIEVCDALLFTSLGDGSMISSLDVRYQ